MQFKLIQLLRDLLSSDDSKKSTRRYPPLSSAQIKKQQQKDLVRDLVSHGKIGKF